MDSCTYIRIYVYILLHVYDYATLKTIPSGFLSTCILDLTPREPDQNRVWDSGLQVRTNHKRLLTLVVPDYGFCWGNCDDDNSGGDDDVSDKEDGDDGTEGEGHDGHGDQTDTGA